MIYLVVRGKELAGLKHLLINCIARGVICSLIILRSLWYGMVWYGMVWYSSDG